MERKGNSATRAKNKYNAANYDSILLRPKIGTKAAIGAAADAVGENMTEYIIKAVEERIERDKKEQEG